MITTNFLMKFHSIGTYSLDATDIIFNILDYLSREGFKFEYYTLSDDPADHSRNLSYSREDLAKQLAMFDIDGIFSFRGIYNQNFQFEINIIGLGTPGSLLKIFVRDIPKQETKSLFRIFEDLNKDLKPVYSGAATPWLNKQPTGQEYNRMLQVKWSQFPKSGPDSIAERTYFSSTLAKLIDFNSLVNIGADVKEAEFGIQIDLLKDPWNQDYEALAKQKKAINEILNKAGVLGDYSLIGRSSPGAKWTEFFHEYIKSIESVSPSSD